MIAALIFGLAVALAGTYALHWIGKNAPAYGLLALVLFICSQSLGFLIKGEPFGTLFMGGWMLGTLPYIVHGFWRLWKRKQDKK